MLDGTAKLDDIIKALQELQGVNQKVDLKSALSAKGVNVLDTDSVADLITKLNSANLVLNGKRVASGEEYSSYTGYGIKAGSSTTNTNTGYPITVNTLIFKPSIILLFSYSLTMLISNSVPCVTVYRSAGIVNEYYGFANISWSSYPSSLQVNSGYATDSTLDKAYVTSTGFKLPYGMQGHRVNWMAIE